MNPQVRSTILMLCFLLANSSSVLAQSNHITILGSESRPLKPETIDAKLDIPISLQYDQVAFQDVMTELGELTGANVLLDQSAMDDSLGHQQEITIKLDNVSLRTALRIMLLEHNATYVLSEGAIRIISLDVAKDPPHFRRKIFNCQGILDKIVENESKYPSNTGYGYGGGGFGGGGGVFNQPPGATPTQEEESPEVSKTDWERIARHQAGMMLSNTIRSTVDPDDWDDTNGDYTAQIFGRLLIVSASEDGLFRVQEFLDNLNKALDEPVE